MIRISDKTAGKFATLLTLAIGFAFGLGFGVMWRPEQPVNAQATPPKTQHIEEVSPGVTTGSFGANLILAHEVATDHMVINGYDLMLMQQNILNYLSTRPLAEPADIQNIINASKAETVYQYKAATPANPTPQTAPGKKP
jgi:hypothetical protein